MNSQSFTQAQKDALIAEALGDVGHLRDEVAKLHADVRLLPSAIEGARDTAIAKIQQTAESLHAAAAEQATKRFIASITSEARSAATEAVSAALYEAQSAVTKATGDLKYAAGKLGTEADWVRGRNAFAWRLGAIAAGLSALAVTVMIVGLLAVASPTLLLNSDQKRQLALGEGIEQVWPRLDDRTRERVQSALNTAGTKERRE